MLKDYNSNWPMSRKFEIFHHIDQKTIDSMYSYYSPVFILTTGRSGSKFIHDVLNQHPTIRSYHEAIPTLQYFSNFAYHNQKSLDKLRYMFEAARMELMLKAYNNNMIYVESNQCLTFFAKAIKILYPKAKFIHLLRHPGSFVRSAIMKGWHQNDTIWESGRVKMQNHQLWKTLNRVEKLAWVWQVTNEFIKNFFLDIDEHYSMTVNLENFTKQPDTINQILRFIGLKSEFIPQEIVNRGREKINELVIHPLEPANMKKIANYPLYEEWSDEEKNCLSKFTKELANYYSYEL